MLPFYYFYLAGAFIFSQLKIHDNKVGKTESYSDFKKKAKTGDLLLFKTYRLHRVLDTTLMQTKWTHSGILYIDDNGKMWEWSSYSRFMNTDKKIFKGFRGGSQLVPLDYLIKLYGGVHYCSIHVNNREHFEQSIKNTIREYHEHISFANKIEMIAIFRVLGCVLSKVTGGSGLTCAQLVTLTYSNAKILKIDRPLISFTPKTLSDEGDASWSDDVTIDQPCEIIGFPMDSFILLYTPSLKIPCIGIIETVKPQETRITKITTSNFRIAENHELLCDIYNKNIIKHIDLFNMLYSLNYVYKYKDLINLTEN